MILALSLVACGPGHQASTSETTGTGEPKAASTVIQNKGSDTMVNLAQAWAENYGKAHPEVAVAVTGGGSGTGIAALENNTVDIANSSREIKTEEAEKIQKASGRAPVTHTVAYDALAIYTHRDNPLQKITKEQLAGIFGEGGTTEKWSDLGVQVPGCSDQTIVRVSRQNNSGTYEYFREWTLGKGDFKLGSRDMQGSKDVVDAVATTPCAIGYSGMGYKTDGVRFVPVAPGPDAVGVLPSVAAVYDHSYPIARGLYMYTAGPGSSAAQAFITWVRTDAGQQVVDAGGFVPLPPAERAPTGG